MVNNLVAFLDKIWEIFDNHGWLGGAVTFVFGAIAHGTYEWIKTRIIDWSYRKKLDSNKLSFGETNTCSLAHGDPFYVNGDIDLKSPKEEFHLLMPNEIYNQIIKINSDFNHIAGLREAWFSCKNYDTFIDQLAKIISFDNTQELKALIEEEKKNVALAMLEKVNAGLPIFIGEKYGIKQINDMRKTENEWATISVQSYNSDFYTHLVMESVYKKLKQKGYIKAPENIAELNKFYPFLTSMGLNIFILLEKLNRVYSVVLVKRSKNLFNMPISRWHVSMNEGVSITDIDPDSTKLSLDKCAQRGLREELGIEIGSQLSFRYTDVFYKTDSMQVGLIGYTKLEYDKSEKVNNSYKIAKDCKFESEGTICVNFTKKSIAKFVKENEMTDDCKYGLEMLLIRKGRNDF